MDNLPAPLLPVKCWMIVDREYDRGDSPLRSLDWPELEERAIRSEGTGITWIEDSDDYCQTPGLPTLVFASPKDLIAWADESDARGKVNVYEGVGILLGPLVPTDDVFPFAIFDGVSEAFKERFWDAPAAIDSTEGLFAMFPNSVEGKQELASYVRDLLSIRLKHTADETWISV